MTGRRLGEEQPFETHENSRNPRLKITTVCLAFALSAMAALFAGPVQTPDLADVQIEVLRVQGNVYMLAGAGGNITVQVGDEGVLVVDTQFAQVSERVITAIRALSDKPIRYIINTHVHPDHTGGNELIAKAGSTLAVGPGAGVLAAGGIPATIIAHENVLHRMAAATEPAIPSSEWPSNTYFGASKEVFFNGEAVQVLHQPAAHTDGDSIVFFRRSDVISTGDIFVTTGYPFIDRERGGSLQGIIDASNRILDLAIPGPLQEGGTVIIPGHGRISEEHDVLEYRNMLTIIRDRIQAMIQKGMTLDEVRAARPTLDYEPRYGSDTGFWTTAMFVEAVYREFSEQ